MHGTLSIVDERHVVTFERRLEQPAETVWTAITDPEWLSAWFPVHAELELELGGAITFESPEGHAPTLDGEIVEYEPPFLIAYTWGDDLLRFEIQPRANVCLLIFKHTFDAGEEAAKFAAGWHISLDGLAAVLTEQEADVSEDRWISLYGRYLVSFQSKQ